jgi:hypothetical protein
MMRLNEEEDAVSCIDVNLFLINIYIIKKKYVENDYLD